MNSLKWKGNGMKRGVRGQQGSESISYFKRQSNAERYRLLPSLSPWKTDVPKFMFIPRCEYSVSYKQRKYQTQKDKI